MDHSTDNVTLCAVFIQDVLRPYEDKRQEYTSLFNLVEGHNLDDPFAQVPIEVYNNVCSWIEKDIGKVSIKRVGREIGGTVFNNLHKNKMISDSPEPHEMMEALAGVAAQMIVDPKRRGWEILNNQDKSLIMRRTQTFNSTLQFGLLESLLYKCKVSTPKVELVKSVEQGDEFDDYLLTWK